MAIDSNTPPLEKTANLLDEDLYWSIIEQARNATEDQAEMKTAVQFQGSLLSM